jgi:GntR family transcriptional repressor for pyruvate dehydrogenase complex
MNDLEFWTDFQADRQNLSARLFDYISSRIIAGTLPGGYCFPNENQLCSQLGIGRSSLREAYAMLAQFGYIRRTKRGTYVNSLYEIISSAPLSATTRGASAQEYKDFRILIEGEIAYQAATKATEEELDQLRVQLERFDPDAPLEELTQADMGFHLCIAQSSHNILLCNTIIAVSGTWRQGVVDGFTHMKNHAPEQLALVRRQHGAIFEALSARTPEKAKQAMSAHLSASIPGA